MDDEEQIEEVEQRVRDEEPVLLIGSPVCRAFSTLIELTQAGKPSEFELKSLVERCVTHLKFCFRMYETQRNSGRLFLHEHPWDAWSRGLSFVNETAEKDGVHKTKVALCRFQLATNSIEKGSWFMSNFECIIEELSKRCYNKGGQAKNHMKNFVVAVLKGLKEEKLTLCKRLVQWRLASLVKNPMCVELDEFAEELQNVCDSISGVRFDPELLSASRKVEIDFMNRLEVHRKRPWNWAKDKGIHVIPTKWVDVNKGDDKRPEYRSRLCGKELKTLGPDDARSVRIGGTVRVRNVLALQSADVETRGKWYVRSEDLVHECFQGTLSGRSDK